MFAVTVERTGRASLAFEGTTSVRDQLRAIVKETFGCAPRRRNFAFLTGLDLYTLTREDLSRRFIASALERHRRNADWL